MAKQERAKKENKNQPIRRELILRAAREKFKEKGFHAATTSEIARRAGVAEGTIFNYFKTKKDLLFALLEPFNTQVMGDFFREATGETDKDSLRLFLKSHLSFVKDNLVLFKILLYESQFYPELRERFIKEVVLKTLKPVEKHLAAGINSGEYRDIDPNTAARAFVGMLTVFVAWSEILHAEPYVQFDENAVIEEVIDIFLNGIRKQSILSGN